MSTYQELKGLKVKYLSSDTSGDRATEGEVFYNSTSGTVASHIASAAWSSTSILGTARRNGAAAAASNSAGLVFAGSLPAATSLTEEYNGTGWSESGDLNTARFSGGGMGTQTAALMAAGSTSGDAPFLLVAETYDGSTWTEVGDLGTQRYGITGAGTQTAGLAFGRTYYPPTNVRKGETEEWDGTSWTESGDLNTARGYLHGFGIQTAAVGAGGMITPGTAATANVEEYNGSTWSEVNNLPATSRHSAAAGTLTAGLTMGKPPQGNTCLFYDGTNWTSAPNLGTGRSAIQGDGTQTSAFAGGGYTTTHVATSEEFNISILTRTAGAWASGGNLNTGRINVSMGGTQTAGIVLGGHTSPGAEPKAVETYNGSAFTSATAIGPYSGDYAAYAGSSTAGIIFGGAPYATNSAEYDGSWTGGGALSTGRSQLMGAGTGATSAVAIGGFTDSTTSTVATEEYGGSSWTAGGNMNTQRGRGAGFGIETAALVVGGNTSPDTAVTANSEEYNGSSWTESGDIFTATGTYIGGWGTQTDGVIVGGANPSYVTTTLGYDGTAWSTRPAAANAAGRTQTAGANGSAGLRAGGGPNTTQRDGSEEFTGATETAGTAKTIDFD